MQSIGGALRRTLLAPTLAAVSFAGRGYPPAPAAENGRLEEIPRAVVLGFEAGIAASRPSEVVWRLDLVDEELRGFAYEGATMALTVRDQLWPGPGGRTREFLLGPAERYAFLTYIGIGFAMARLPRVKWRRVLPDLSGSPYYPGLSWLAVDGYGFDLAYFHPRRWVDEQRIPRPYPWLGGSAYFPRAVDQGIGRALWFIHAARVPEVAAAVGRFPGQRQPDLWSGVGLAAAFAGGASEPDLAKLRAAAGDQWPELAQGAGFAAKARTFAGLVPAHTERTVGVLTGCTALDAAAVVDAAVEATGTSDPTLVYEEWRSYVRQRFAHIQRAIY